MLCFKAMLTHLFVKVSPQWYYGEQEPIGSFLPYYHLVAVPIRLTAFNGMCMRSPLPDTYLLIGAGRLASALATALFEKGMRPELVASRTSTAAERLATRFEKTRATSIDDLAAISGSLTLISVSDDALVRVAEHLSRVRSDWTGHTVLHTSGSWSSEALTILGERGASIGSFHPVQTFTKIDSDPLKASLFAELPIAVEGDDAFAETAFSLANLLGSAPFRITADAKTLLHAAAVTASNYLVTLYAIANEIAASTTEGDSPVSSYFKALSSRAIQNVIDIGPEKALTGPIVRGDIRVLSAHLTRLSEILPHLVPVYAALATETIRMAAGSGAIDPKVADEMLVQLETHLHTYRLDQDR